MHDRQAAEGGPDRAAEIVGDAVGGDRSRKIRFWDERRQDRKPGRRIHRPCGAEQERRQEQRRGRGKAQRHDAGEGDDKQRDCAGDVEDQPARIDNVRQRSSRQGEQEHRQIGRRLDQRHVERIESEGGHQPPGRGVVHRDSDKREGAGQPDDGEVAVREGAKPSLLLRSGRLGNRPLHAFPVRLRLVRRQHAAVAAQEKVAGDAAERPLAQAAVAECAGDDQVGLKVASARGELLRCGALGGYGF